MDEQIIVLTENALLAMREACKEVGERGGIRLAIRPGGCSGFQYDLTLVDGGDADDMVQGFEGGQLFVDPFSLQYLRGVTVDHVSSLSGSGFRFDNPNAIGGCGCGSSFSA